MEIKEKYSYYIVWRARDDKDCPIISCDIIDRTGKIKGVKDLNEVKRFLEKNGRVNRLIVMNFILLESSEGD